MDICPKPYPINENKNEHGWTASSCGNCQNEKRHPVKVFGDHHSILLVKVEKDDTQCYKDRGCNQRGTLHS